MKLLLDVTEKTITIEESINIAELIKMVKSLLPGGEWKKYGLICKEIVNWVDPVVIERPYWNRPYPTSPWWIETAQGTSTANGGVIYMGGGGAQEYLDVPPPRAYCIDMNTGD